MLWYVLQTKTGGEEKLVEMIRRRIPKDLYGECFCVYHEQLWRRQQKTFVHVKRAFPGYIFITSKEPEALFFCLKKLPAMLKMMADEECFFLSLDPEEADFLRKIMDEKHVIGLSYLETNGEGKILQVSGPLRLCISRMLYCKFGKRYALVRIPLLGKEKDVLLGIILKEDICQELKYEKVEVPFKLPELYPMEWASAKEKELQKINRNPYSGRQKVHPLLEAINSSDFIVGDYVVVTDGIFRGMSGMVYQADAKRVKIGICFLGRMVEMEMPAKLLKKERF